MVQSNNGGGSQVTDSSGHYELFVPDNWTGDVAPSKVGYVFTPVSGHYTGTTTDQTGLGTLTRGEASLSTRASSPRRRGRIRSRSLLPSL